MHKHPITLVLAAILALAAGLVQAAPLMIVGNDEKLLWDDDGKPIISPAGKDSVLSVDLADPENPKIVANLQLKNSVAGPPVNVHLAVSASATLPEDHRTTSLGLARVPRPGPLSPRTASHASWCPQLLSSTGSY